MSIARSEHNAFSAPLLPSERLSASPFIQNCQPHLRSIVVGSLSAIHYAARHNLGLLSNPILGDGIHTIVDEAYARHAINGPYLESVKGIPPYAISAARVLGVVIAASRLARNDKSSYVTCNIQRRGEEPITHHRWKLAATGMSVEETARNLFLQRNVESLGIHYTTNRHQLTYDLQLSAQFTEPSADVFNQEFSFANIQLTSNTFPDDEQSHEKMVTTTVSSGRAADGFVHTDQRTTFASLDPFCKLINHLVKIN